MVPNGWTAGKVSDVIQSIESGVSVNGEDRKLEPNELGILKVSAVSYGYFNPSACKAINIEEIPRAKINPKKGQIIISRSNTPELVGASAYVDKDYSHLFLPDKLWQTIPKPNQNMKWLSYVLALPSSRYYLSDLATGTSSSMKNITQEAFLSLKLLIPSVQEQQKIAEILSTWDKAIASTEKLIANSEQQKKALMQQLLTGKKRLLDENGDRFSGEWEKIIVKNIFKLKTETSGSNTYKIYSVTKNGLINQQDYFNKEVASADTSKYKIVHTNEFVMSGLNFWMGSVDIHLENFSVIVSPAYKTYKISKKFNILFLKYFVRSTTFLKVLMGSSVMGASIVRRNFNSEIFENWSLSIPKIQEQKKIAEVLSNADREIELLQAKLEHLKQEKKALMQQLLTGKRRVTGG